MKSASLEIIQILKQAGHTAYWAGGCVRDMLLGIQPKDFDIVTSATPDQIEDLLEKTVPIGKKFGVILAVKDGHHFEIATFRSDAGYSDGRRPDAVIFTDPSEDAFRRDFTINALFYDPDKDQIIDHVDGQKDLRDKLVRFIGDPQQRIQEDHLRILRAVRFKNCYDLQYHPETYRAIRENVHLISKISPERVRDELNKMITDQTNPGQSFEELFEIGALTHIIPELCQLKGLAQPLQYHQEGDVWDHSIRALNSLTDEENSQDPLPENPPTLALKWATLFHDIGKYPTFFQDQNRIRYDKHAEVGADISKDILKRLRFQKSVIDRVHWLIEHHMMVVPLMEMNEGARRKWFLKPGFEELLELYRADASGIIPLDLSAYHQIKKLYKSQIAKLKLMPEQLLSGNEIMELLNLTPGAQVGEIIKDLRHKQLNGDLKNKKQAIDYLKLSPSSSKPSKYQTDRY